VGLGRAGFDPDRLEQLERADLLEALAETMLREPVPEAATDFVREAREASQVPLPAENLSSATSDGGSAALGLRELELEEKRAEREREERQAVREAEERKAAREAEQRRLEIEDRREQRAMEERRAERDARLKTEQIKLEHEIRLEELKARQARPGATEGGDGQTPSDPIGAVIWLFKRRDLGE